MKKSIRLFDENTRQYASARPQYPVALFEYLHSVCAQQNKAWDCGTGNGQAALGLANFFKKVESSDISETQIDQAIPKPNIQYSVQPAEKTCFNSKGFDLITVAQALHWFDLKAFWLEVKRLLKPNGVFATWGYHWFSVEQKIDAIIQKKILSVIKPYWAKENELLWNGYQDIDFPFPVIKVPAFKIEVEWNLHQLFEYLNTWSAIKRAKKIIGDDFMTLAFNAVSREWQSPENIKKHTMPLHVIVCHNGN